MEYIEPLQKGFIIYSKSGCINCLDVKRFLKQKNFLFEEINCDDYLLDNRDQFLTFIENITNKNHKTFPIVFYDGKFIGGFDNTKEFVNKLLLSFEEVF